MPMKDKKTLDRLKNNVCTYNIFCTYNITFELLFHNLLTELWLDIIMD